MINEHDDAFVLLEQENIQNVTSRPSASCSQEKIEPLPLTWKMLEFISHYRV
jgi:hypothetical protein